MEEEAPATPGLWRLFRATWRSMFVLQLAVLLIGAALAGPFLSGFTSLAVRASGSPVINDTDIAETLLSPGGVLLMILVAAAWLTVLLFGYAAQLVAAHRGVHGGDTRALSCLIFVARHIRSVTLLSLRFILQTTALALPFLLLIIGVLYLQLRQRDISYYIIEQPPEFLLAVALTLLLAVAMLFVLIRHTIDWLHALPLVLFRNETPAKARIHSKRLVAGKRVKLFFSLLLWVVLPPLLMAAANLPWPPLLLYCAEFAEHRVGLISLLFAVILGLSAGIGFLIHFLFIAFFALYHTRLFIRTGHDRKPETAPDEPRKSRLPWQIGIAAAVVILGLTALHTYDWLEDLKKDRPTLVIAHRGASSEAPENTLAAVQAAIDAGADWVEIDVQEHRNGEIYVFHDKSFSRISGSESRLREASDEELADTDIGSWFDKKFSDQRTPTLRQVLELCRDKIGVLIELKYYGGEEKFEERVVSIVEASGMSEQVMLMTFEQDGLKKIRKLHPEWPIGLLTTVNIGDLSQLDVDFLGIGQGALGTQLVRRAEKAGIDIYVWTVNEPIVMSSVISRGADGLITDRPRVARRVKAARSDLNPSERMLIDLAGRFGQLEAHLSK
ncbi:hypothetical protein HAHE_26700 [Haloferula helveola]|uniref:GP-PDE domain-containing protein n=1 Tax=Haloferula helveola TaxID=490095 RepID=A0ABN6H510_9BACT|nr:hypothetical protein HAHE_26700 [Haloferula helveola]